MGDFDEAGYVVLEALIDAAERAAILAYALDFATRPRAVRGDVQVPNTPSAYAAPRMESLLLALIPKLEAATGRSLSPTYSYFRVYKRGDELEKHTDREACELSVSLCIAYRADGPWPLWIEPSGEPKAVLLGPGDALLYKGMTVPHWREPFTGEQAVQVFLHYVDRNGPHADWIYDRRCELSII